MTVAAQTPINTYAYAGSSTFIYSFQVLRAADLVVTVDGATKTLNVDYTVAGVGVQGGGTVTYLGALTAGQIVALRRVTLRARDTDYQNNGDLLAATVNADFDRLWMAAQENDTLAVTRALLVPIGETAATLPPAAVRAGYLLGFDSAGNPLAVVPGPSGTATTLALDLANVTQPAKGSGQIGYFLGAVGSYPWDALSWMRRKVSVLDFVPAASRAAARAGTYDCAAAISAALLACLPATPTFSFSGTDYHLANAELEFEPGRYKVSSTVSIAGFSATKKAVGLSIRGPRLTPVYAGGSTALDPAAVTIVADPATFVTANQAVLDLQNCHYCVLSGLAVKGVYTLTKAVDVSNGVGWGMEGVSVYQHKYGIFNNLSSGAHYRNIGATNCSATAIYLKDSGDSDIESAFLNTNNQDYVADANKGQGIYIATSNNTNIRGGKIEYCSIGIYINNCQGLNIDGINFDCNAQCHILGSYDSVSGLTPNSLQLKSISISGNRSLAGGHAVGGTLPKAHIVVTCGSSPVNMIIVGNSFRKGSGLAFDENTGGAQPVGPGTYCIYVDHQGDATYTANFACDGNDFWNGSLINAIGTSAPNGANVNFVGRNVSNLPNSINAGTGSFLFEATNLIAPNAASPAAVGIMVRDIIANFAGTMTLTLPPATPAGRRLNIRTIQAQLVNSASANVVPRGSLTAGTAILAATAGAWAELVSDGTAWQTMAAG